MNIPSTHLSLFLPLQKDGQSEEGWKAFHARYHEVILTWCLRRELSSAVAEDLTQEIWLKLLKEIRKYDPAKGRLRSWLKAVVNNTLTDYWRRQRDKPERGGVGGTAFLEQVGGVVSPEAADELSMAIETRANSSADEVLARVRSRLHEKTWQAFYLTLVEQRPAKDVAEELGISVASVYKDTYRVKQMLYKEYRNVHPEASNIVLPGADDTAAVSE
ncbi:MAG TPA: sigma-70 family RNA polymerase sigma factor [Gemmataceae bacterium]|nr:sigma-70 family RNA polymerase sigma factor [Gemmataceae bacterium]